MNHEYERGPADPCLGQEVRVLPAYLNAQAASYTLQQDRAGPGSSTNFRLTQRDITLPTAASILALQKAAILLLIKQQLLPKKANKLLTLCLTATSLLNCSCSISEKPIVEQADLPIVLARLAARALKDDSREDEPDMCL